MPTEPVDVLVVDEDDGLTLPPEYTESDTNLTVRVPTTTIQIRANFPLDGTVPLVEPRHFDVENSRDPANEHLAPDHVELKKHGESAQRYQVQLPISP